MQGSLNHTEQPGAVAFALHGSLIAGTFMLSLCALAVLLHVLLIGSHLDSFSKQFPCHSFSVSFFNHSYTQGWQPCSLQQLDHTQHNPGPAYTFSNGNCSTPAGPA